MSKVKLTISDIMTKCMIAVDMLDSVENIERVMAQNKLSSVSVLNRHTQSMRNKCIGVIDLALLARPHALKRNPRTTLAWEICTRTPMEVGPEMTLNDAAGVMVASEIDLLVVSKDKIIVGYVSSIDVLNALKVDAFGIGDDMHNRLREIDAHAAASRMPRARPASSQHTDN